MPITDPDYPVPAGLTTDEFVLRPIKATDAAADYAAVMETRAELRLWEQSDWPADDFTVEGNREDLVGLEERHGAHSAYTYTVVDPAGTEALGCVYVFPTGAKFLAGSEVTPLGDARWDEVEAVVYFWVRRSRMDAGMDARLLGALRGWFATAWGLSRVVFVTNEQFGRQVELIERTDLRRRFELREPDKAGAYLVYG
jgi:hypothetical protein